MSIIFWFYWGKYKKPMTSMLIGISPELEMALYTLCYYTRPDKDCFVSLAGEKFMIKTRTYKSRGAKELRAAYFFL